MRWNKYLPSAARYIDFVSKAKSGCNSFLTPCKGELDHFFSAARATTVVEAMTKILLLGQPARNYVLEWVKG